MESRREAETGNYGIWEGDLAAKVLSGIVRTPYPGALGEERSFQMRKSSLPSPRRKQAGRDRKPAGLSARIPRSLPAASLVEGPRWHNGRLEETRRRPWWTRGEWERSKPCASWLILSWPLWSDSGPWALVPASGRQRTHLPSVLGWCCVFDHRKSWYMWQKDLLSYR